MAENISMNQKSSVVKKKPFTLLIIAHLFTKIFHLFSGIKAKKCLYEGVIVPTALYGAEAWSMRSAERRKVNVLEMKCWRNLVGVSRMDRVRNEEVRRRAGIERELASRANQRVLRWFGHVEKMDEYRMARRVLMAEVSEGRVKERPRLGWMDGVKEP